MMTNNQELLQAEVTVLRIKIRELERIISETLIFAKRYADGRCTYAPGLINDAIDDAEALGVDLRIPDGEEKYARDGQFWDHKRGLAPLNDPED